MLDISVKYFKKCLLFFYYVKSLLIFFLETCIFQVEVKDWSIWQKQIFFSSVRLKKLYSAAF